jgi:anion-transporting  ArsA/GET3 family ATPase
MLGALAGRRVLFVVGKGGVGKSTVATALAVALAEAGKRVLLAQMEPSRRLAEFLGVDGDGEVEAVPHLCVLTVDGESALSEYLGLVLPVRRVQRMVVESKLYHHFVAAAPGLKELMTVGKIWYEEQLTVKGRRKWDVIVVDAPATGHVLQYLRMPSAAAEAFGPGLVRREAQRVMELLVDPDRTAVCPVTTAEEMPVNETTEMYQQLRERLHMPLGVLFVNRVHASPLAPTDVPVPPAGAGALVADVLRCAREEAGWTAINDRYLDRLRTAVPMPTVLLPFLFAEEFGLDEVRALMANATRQLDPLEGRG